MPPPAPVLEAFGLSGKPTLLPGGQGTTWRVGDVVIKPSGYPPESRWRAQILAALADPPSPAVPPALAAPALADSPALSALALADSPVLSALALADSPALADTPDLAGPAVRLARPVPALDGDWVAHGWEAFHHVAGHPDPTASDAPSRSLWH